MAAYLMLKEACLSETSVARFLRIEPAQAYLRAIRFEQSWQKDQDLRTLASACVSEIVERLTSD
jgi:hypothetical protein